MHKVKAYLQIARPHQYMKNAFIWLPLFFGYKLNNLHAIVQTSYAFLVFCLAASSVYVLNDLKDIEEDRKHPVKKFRPLASGVLGQLEAVILFLIFLFFSCSISFVLLPNKFFAIIGAYLLLNIVYSIILKHVAIIDVICIATGFVLRIFAGGIAAEVEISHWLVIMTFLIALFLAFAKRRDDLLLEDRGYNTRKCLDGYSPEFASGSMLIMASVTIVSYILYTVSPEIIEKHGTNKLYLTAFWVIVGLLRYLQTTFVMQRSGSPTLLLLKDYFLQAVIILWILSCYLVLYVFEEIV
jgi:4-hydroxybenzoate polyprenyltransferase